PSGYGRVMRDARGRVLRIVEEKDAAKRDLRVRECNTGVLAAPAKLLRKWLRGLKNKNAQGEYYLTDVIAAAVKEGIAVNPLVAPTVTEVLGVNDKVQLAELEGVYRARIARELLLAGVTIADRARIGPNCVVRNSEIGDDTVVFPNCVIDSAIIGQSCNIGPFARFRPSSRLADEVHIGNFVEVKNSQLGAGSKANHLTYVGDAQVGSRVNLGAGTIVANYDGANKHLTRIE